jgi:hypothetical protein
VGSCVTSQVEWGLLVGSYSGGAWRVLIFENDSTSSSLSMHVWT